MAKPVPTCALAPPENLRAADAEAPEPAERRAGELKRIAQGTDVALVNVC
jgi:hypothetical protein